jgi:hypothetical protein
MQMNSYTCESCKTPNTSILDNPALVICRQCHHIAYQNASMQLRSVGVNPVPEDWSFVKIGSEITHNNDSLTVVGRVRFELRNDYKNFWCAALKNGTYIWIMESFASFCILGSSWKEYKHDIDTLHADAAITLPEDLKVRGEYVEKCESLSYEGELGDMKFIEPGFFFIQFSNNQNQTAVFFVRKSNDIEYLTGGKIDVEKLNLKNIITWDEWK